MSAKGLACFSTLLVSFDMFLGTLLFQAVLATILVADANHPLFFNQLTNHLIEGKA